MLDEVEAAIYDAALQILRCASILVGAWLRVCLGGGGGTGQQGQPPQPRVRPLRRGEGFAYDIPSRAKGNQVYVKELDRIVLNEAISKRPLRASDAMLAPDASRPHTAAIKAPAALVLVPPLAASASRVGFTTTYVLPTMNSLHRRHLSWHLQCSKMGMAGQAGAAIWAAQASGCSQQLFTAGTPAHIVHHMAGLVCHSCSAGTLTRCPRSTACQTRGPSARRRSQGPWPAEDAERMG